MVAMFGLVLGVPFGQATITSVVVVISTCMIPLGKVANSGQERPGEGESSARCVCVLPAARGSFRGTMSGTCVIAVSLMPLELGRRCVGMAR
jgi:hypothetical protein